MEPNKSSLMLALRTPFRMTAVLVSLLVVAGSAAAQIPALPATDDLPIDTGIDVGAASPIGTVNASAHDDHARVCTDSYASSQQVTSQLPPLPALPVAPVPAYGVPAVDLGSELSGCTEVDAGQTLDDAAQQADGAKQHAESFIGEVKGFFDDMWNTLFGSL